MKTPEEKEILMANVALIAAVKNGAIDTLRECLQVEKVNIDYQDLDDYPATITLKKWRYQNICPTLKGSTALILAAEKGHNEMCQMLVSKRCNLDTQNEDGWTAFIVACYKGNVALAISLVEAGCNYLLKTKTYTFSVNHLDRKYINPNEATIYVSYSGLDLLFYKKKIKQVEVAHTSCSFS